MKILKIGSAKRNIDNKTNKASINSAVSKPNAITTISKGGNDAIKHNAMANISFHGRTVYPKCTVTGRMYSTTSIGQPNSWSFEMEEGAVPIRKDINVNSSTKIYIADPDEIIPEEIYKTHDFIKKTDLYLSQIESSYKNGFQNFAQNALLEKEHFEALQSDAQARLDKNIAEKNHRINLLDSITQEDSKIQEKLRRRYNQEIKIRETEIEKAQKDLKRANDKIEKASKRFDVMVELDNFGGKKAALIKKQQQIIEEIENYSNNDSLSYKRGIIQKQEDNVRLVVREFKRKAKELNKKKADLNKPYQNQDLINDPAELKLLNKAKAKAAIVIEELEAKFIEEKLVLVQKFKEEKALLTEHKLYLASLKEQLKNMDVDFTNIDAKLDSVFPSVKKFYEHNYTHWCR